MKRKQLLLFGKKSQLWEGIFAKNAKIYEDFYFFCKFFINEFDLVSH